jgi:PAS domain S-box-containing protein
MNSWLSIIDLLSGLACLVLVFEILYLRIHRSEFAANTMFVFLGVALAIGALFFVTSALSHYFANDMLSLVCLIFLPSILWLAAAWLGKSIVKIRSLPTIEHQDAEAALEALINSSPLPIVAINAQGKVMLWNLASEQLFGWSAAEVTGHSIPFVPAERSAEHEWLLAATRKGEPLTRFETKRLNRQGELIDVCIWTASFCGTDPTRVSSMAIFEDIREKRIASCALERAKAAADQAILAKKYFLASMSHEIRTPLGVIIGYSELLKDPRFPVEQQAHRIAAIHRSILQLNHLIGDILDVSKIEIGDIHIDSSVVNLREMLDEMETFFSSKAAAKGISFSVDIEAGFPEHAYTDVARVKQILLNLVGGAIKFTEKGRVILHVKNTPMNDAAKASAALGEMAPGEKQVTEVIFRLQDCGIEMTELERASIFQSASQVSPDATVKFGGAGLGLYMAKKIAQSLGGDLNLETYGSPVRNSFVLSLPMEVLPLSSHQPLPMPLDKSSRGALKGKHVLLAEDHIGEQEFMLSILREAEATVSLAQSEQQTIELMQSTDFDIVLMDVQVPALNGCQVVRRLRQQGYKKKIIAVSSFARNEEQAQCIRAGCDAFVSKAATSRELLSTIEQNLN